MFKLWEKFNFDMMLMRLINFIRFIQNFETKITMPISLFNINRENAGRHIVNDV